MGRFSSIFRGGDRPLLPMTIQDVESILERRKGRPDAPVVLTIGDERHVLLRKDDYDRIMRVVESIEAMAEGMVK